MSEEDSPKLTQRNYPFISLTLKTLLPLILISVIVISIFSVYLSETAKNNTKQYLVENVLLPEFRLLSKSKDDEFARIKEITEYTAKKIEDRIAASKNRSQEETDSAYNTYVFKNADGSQRSRLDESRGRYQMATFHNNKSEADLREKNIVIDAFVYFEPLIEGLMPILHDSYFTTNNFIWEYGAPDWPLTVAADEIFSKYNWVYEADPEQNPEGKQVWTDMYYDDVQHEWMVSSLMPIFDEEEYVGTLGQDLILKEIIEITQKTNNKEIGTIFFIDNLGNIVAHPDTEYILGQKGENDERLNLKTLSDKPLTSVLQAAEGKTEFAFTNEDHKRIVMYFPLQSIDWKMVYVVREEDFLKIITQTNSQLIIAFIVLALVVVSIIAFIIKFLVTSKIKKLTEVTTDISNGNLDKNIDIQSNDEIGELANSFRQMTSNLKTSRNKIEGNSKELVLEVEKRTKELEQKMNELTELNNLMVDRELKMTELKKEIEELKNGHG